MQTEYTQMLIIYHVFRRPMKNSYNDMDVMRHKNKEKYFK